MQELEPTIGVGDNGKEIIHFSTAVTQDEADRLLQLNINLLRQMVDEPDVLLDGKNKNGQLFDKQNHEDIHKEM